MRVRISLLAAASCLIVAVVMPSIASAKGTNLKAKMTGAQVVGTAGAPDGTGRANLHILKGKGRLCFEVQWDKIGNKQGLNIGVYTGKEGKNGNEFIPLVDVKQTSPIEDCVEDVAVSDLKALEKHPENYHVTVKNKKFDKDGAVRGQLKAV